MIHPELKPGLRFEWTYLIPARATVPQLYRDTDFCRDMPDVLATGYLVGMLELACVNGIMPYVDWPREQTVGTYVAFHHLAATPAGMRLTIKGTLRQVDGRRLAFHIEAWDEEDKIAEGEHECMIIVTEKFNARMAQKKARIADEPRN